MIKYLQNLLQQNEAGKINFCFTVSYNGKRFISVYLKVLKLSLKITNGTEKCFKALINDVDVISGTCLGWTTQDKGLTNNEKLSFGSNFS